jgi:6,7-dimethyl-8-ribityllumazine synthase
MNIALVVSEFNQDITSRMLSVAQEKADSMKLKITHISKILGSYDMPIIVDALLKKNEIDGVVTLGAIITGQTKHDEVISHATAKTLSELSIKYQKPVSLGIIGPALQEKHAHARIRPVAEHAVESAERIFDELKRIK